MKKLFNLVVVAAALLLFSNVAHAQTSIQGRLYGDNAFTDLNGVQRCDLRVAFYSDLNATIPFYATNVLVDYYTIVYGPANWFGTYYYGSKYCSGYDDLLMTATVESSDPTTGELWEYYLSDGGYLEQY